MRPNILHNIPPCDHHTTLNPFTNPHTKILMYVHLHIFYCKFLNPRTNIHMNILPQTYLHKILPDAHITPQNPHKNLHMEIILLKHLHKPDPIPTIHLYILTQSYINFYLHAVPSPTLEHIFIIFIKIYPGYIKFPPTCTVGALHLVSHLDKALYLVMHGVI